MNGFSGRTEPVMKSDIREYDDHYDVSMELAGYGRDDIHVDLDGGYLTVQATQKSNNDEKDEQGRVIRSERYTGSCQRSFFVGDNVSREDIQAAFSDGILHLNIRKPALEAPKDETRYIDIQ